MREFCNPLNLSYKYQHYTGIASREAADPTMILFKGKYYLFASMSGGFFWSEDLAEWHWHENRELDLYRYAPDVHEIGDWLIFCASNHGISTFWRTKDPLSDRFEKVSEPFSFWDPASFQDDDGRVYFYWGCNAGKPIYGQELDREKLTPIGDVKELLYGQPDEHGWERPKYPGAPELKFKTGFVMKLLTQALKLFGQSSDQPYIEGGFLNKFRGKYYLQYAAPGTELPTYGDGVYVSDEPLGGFTYQAHNPFSSKPGGFIQGAGHGSTIEDVYGNLWHASTMRISVNQSFERRIGLFPAGADKDGILFCNQSFADYPLEIPEGKFDPMSVRPKWMLLSFQKPCVASSWLPGHEPKLAVNEDIRSSWCAKGCAEEWLQVDLEKVYSLHAVQVNFADVDVPMKKVPKNERADFMAGNRYIDTSSDLKTRWLLEGSVDGEAWFTLADKRNAQTDLPHDYVVLEGCQTRYLRITAAELPYGQHFALSGLRVFGLGEGEKPAAVEDFEAAYTDPMTARLTWKRDANATGYEVQYGIAPDKLYSSHMVYDANEVLLTTLNKGQAYYIRIDSFNENGVTLGEVKPLS